MSLHKTEDAPPVLDPGTRRRRRTGSPCVCICWTIAAFVGIFAAYVGYLLLARAVDTVNSLRYPHSTLHYNTTSGGDAVRPLISEDQTFDVILSIWLRAPEDEEAAYLAENPLTLLEEQKALLDSMLDFSWMLPGSNPVASLLRRTQASRNLEEPLLSDVVFKDVRLSDRGRSSAIPIRVPTARFAGQNLTVTDMRATFMIIPSSTSPLDHISNYSSWKPEAVSLARSTRAWPFPLGVQGSHDKSLRDLALESFSVSLPMIRFHEVKDRCNNGGTSDTEDENTEDDDTVSKPLPAHKNHPHIVTRAELRIVDNAPMYAHEAYAAKHAALKQDPCGAVRMSFQPVWPFCDRAFFNNGHFEAYVEVQNPHLEDGTTEWMYAPFLDIRNEVAGPKDIIPVPVNRQACEPGQPPATDEDAEFMDITLHVDFAGETPGRAALVKFMNWQSPPHTHEGEYVQVMAHNNAELWNSLRGHIPREDARPRLRILLAVLSGFGSVAVLLLDFVYWYKCTSTVTISVRGTELLIAMQIVSYIDSVFNAAVDDPEDWWVYLLVHTFELLLPFFMAKAIYRWELGWREGARWVPTVRRSPATHKERASARADVREMDDRATFMVLFVGLLFGIIVRDHALLPALHPAPDEANALRYRAINFAFGYAMNALWWAGQCRQILLRRRAQRFAGQYRASAVFFCLATWSEFVGHLTSVVGHYDARPAYLLAQVPSLAIAGWAASQAFTLPPEKGDDADEDEE